MSEAPLYLQSLHEKESACLLCPANFVSEPVRTPTPHTLNPVQSAGFRIQGLR